LTKCLDKIGLKGSGRVPEVTYSEDLPRLLGLGVERRGEEAEGEGGCERSTYDHHAAPVCWLSTAAIFRQPSILRNLICPSPLVAVLLDGRLAVEPPTGRMRHFSIAPFLRDIGEV
jgi:hypothetical protein